MGLVHNALDTIGASYVQSCHPNCKEGHAEGMASDWSEVALVCKMKYALCHKPDTEILLVVSLSAYLLEVLVLK